MGKYIDITNQKFGKLTALYISGNDKRGEKIWHCECECGNEIDALSSNLRRGATKSCGCYRKETPNRNRYINDITNQRFGKLVALYPTDKRLNNQVIWHCQCDCGNTADIRSYNLTSGKTLSCGCLSQSHGEFIIQQLLTSANIPFEKEKTFSDCVFNDTKQNARFDFYVDNKYIIEFDGEQHFFYDDSRTWNTKEHFIKTRNHDNYKNNWCKEHNIPIIRIPYFHLSKLCLEDLILETSIFKLEQE